MAALACPGSPMSSGSNSPLGVDSLPGSPIFPKALPVKSSSPPRTRISDECTQRFKNIKAIFEEVVEKKKEVTVGQQELYVNLQELERIAQDALVEIEGEAKLAQNKVITALEAQLTNQRLVRTLEETTDALKAQAKEIEDKHTQVCKELDDVKRQLSSSDEQIRGTQQQLVAKTNELLAGKQSLEEALEKIGVLTSAVNEAQVGESAFTEHCKRLKGENAQLNGVLQSKNAKITELQEQVTKALEEGRRANESLAALQGDQDKRMKRVQSCEEKLSEYDRTFQSQSKTAEELKVKTNKLLAEIAEKNRMIEELKKASDSKVMHSSALKSPTKTATTPDVNTAEQAVETEKDEIITRQKRMITTLKKVAYVAVAVLLIIVLGVACYWLFPKLVAATISGASQLWKFVAAWAAKAPQTTVANPAYYALRGRLGI